MSNIIPWEVRPTDSLGNDIAIGEKIAFILTDYSDRFEKICTGKIVGFTKQYVKIKPDNYMEHHSFHEWRGNEQYPYPKEFIKRYPQRVIKIPENIKES